MFQNLSIFQTATGLAQHSAFRQGLIARNIANADTPGYAALDAASFVRKSKGGMTGLTPRVTNPRHFGAERTPVGQTIEAPGQSASANGNGVSLEIEMVKSVDAARTHSKALAIYRSHLTVLRACLGQG